MAFRPSNPQRSLEAAGPPPGRWVIGSLGFWQRALAEFVPDHQQVLMYKPSRWAEYGLQFYRFNHVRAVFSPEELMHATAGEQRILCIADDKALQELSHLPNIDMKVVHTIGNQTAFWAWQGK